jgi:DNA polymerase III delta prime subunit
MLRDEYLWSEKFRPKTVTDAILPERIKSLFQNYVKDKNIPHLILCGSPGIGKTSAARAMLDELASDYKFYNASLDRNLDTLRNDILNYATSVSFYGGRKYVVLDEADNLNPNSFQPALRGFMDMYGNNCGFILTCNYPGKIIEPLHSRCKTIDFTIELQEKVDLACQFLDRVISILDQEKVKYDKQILAKVIEKRFPDWRKMLMELQGYAGCGKIDAGILSNFTDVSLKKLIGFVKEQNFTDIRKWVAENTMDSNDFYHNLYSNMLSSLTKIGQPMAVLLIGKYEYEAAFSLNHEINMTACLVDLMLHLKGEWL